MCVCVCVCVCAYMCMYMSAGVCLPSTNTSLVVAILSSPHTHRYPLCPVFVLSIGTPFPCRYDGGDFSGGEDNVDDFEDVQVSLMCVQLPVAMSDG